MTNYGRVRSINRPQDLEITATSVFIASNIHEFTEEYDNGTVNGYEYDYVGYNKDEYITIITNENARAISELTDELAATKILLGVD